MAAAKPADAKKVLAEVTKPHTLEHVHTNESVSTAAAKVQLELKKKPDLEHVDAPKAGLTDSQKAAYVEEKKATKAAPKKK